jgi:hypothetical protein
VRERTPSWRAAALHSHDKILLGVRLPRKKIRTSLISLPNCRLFLRTTAGPLEHPETPARPVDMASEERSNLYCFFEQTVQDLVNELAQDHVVEW